MILDKIHNKIHIDSAAPIPGQLEGEVFIRTLKMTEKTVSEVETTIMVGDMSDSQERYKTSMVWQLCTEFFFFFYVMVLFVRILHCIHLCLLYVLAKSGGSIKNDLALSAHTCI